MADERDEAAMTEATRKLAREQPPVQPGSGTIAWSPEGSAGASQNDGSSSQPPDSRIAQQGHQPAQGSEGDGMPAADEEDAGA